MTVSSENYRNDYDGDGSTDTFAYTFKILDESHLRVLERDAAGVERTLTLNTDYTVTGVGTAAGGNVVLAAGNLTADHHLTILRNLPFTQETDLRNQGRYSPEVVETALDRCIMLMQQIQEELDRAVKLSDTSESDPDALLDEINTQVGVATAAAATATTQATTATDAATAAEDAASDAAATLSAAGLPASPAAGNYLRRNAGGTAYEDRTPQQVADELTPLLTTKADADDLTALDDDIDFAIHDAGNVTISSRYVLANPFPGHQVICIAEVQIGGVWGETGFIFSSADSIGYGVKASQYGDDIVIRTGGVLMASPADGGAPHLSTAAAPLPCRVKIWKVKGGS